MKNYILLISILLSACSGGSSNDSPVRYEPVDDLDISDLEGYWLNSCKANGDVYSNDVIEYQPNTNEAFLGFRYFSDANCSTRGDSTNNLPVAETYGYTIEPLGVYTNSEGIEAKVIELTLNLDGTVSQFAYFIQADNLYVSIDSFQFNYEDAYVQR